MTASPADLFESFPDRPWPFLLESARSHPVTGRYSFLGSDPVRVMQVKGSRLLIGPPGHEVECAGDPMQELRAWLAHPRLAPIEGLPPFVGGAVGIFGYDTGRFFERWPSTAIGDAQLPLMAWGLYDTVVAVDHAEGALWVITRVLPDRDASSAYEAGMARLESWIARLQASRPSARWSTTRETPVVADMDRAGFERMVRQAKRWIADGEIYQANLSQRFHAELTEPACGFGKRNVPHHRPLAWALYRRLRVINPSPFAGYLDTGEAQLISASPERLVRVAEGVVETRPIAGTWPRTGQEEVDRAALQQLINHPKERAEHLMLVDLERNDLGRVCAYGTVQVDEMMALEAYSHVFHIVSNVRGRLQQGRDWADVVAAMFPGGTITGCPKIRAIELIDQLEPVRRQWYTGSLGYISFSGAMDLNLIIRSAIVMGNRVSMHVGAGIVADSDPSREYEETLHKAQALWVALQHSEAALAQEAELHVPVAG